MQIRNMDFIISYLSFLMLLLIRTEATGRSNGPNNNVGEYSPPNGPPKPYSFNYEVTDEHGNVHYRREEGDPSGTIIGSYGYMNLNGLFRSVEYMADSGGFKAKVKTNEPGAKGPGSADVELQADPVPQGLMQMLERKAAPAAPQATRKNYPGMKG